MDQADRDELRTRMMTEIVKVKKDILALQDLARPVEPDNAIGRLTRMEAISARGISEAKLKDAKNRLIMLDQALSRADSKNFGNCRECGDPIRIARLKLLPETTLCVECAQG
ncbi:MAG: TraR/DksA C4-type zinc finger protein [Proteobacteria bacterium]|nr:TraR/DksA C4-type zinc finger protein [Pseudomonadota bacterium]MBU1736530.1 TraR/DksA C4-type zinc finger protein [Pseudomonadota bacterium]